MGRESSGNDDSNHTDNRTIANEFINQLLLHDLTNHLLVVQGNVEFLIDQIDDSEALNRLQTIDSQTMAAFSLLQETKSMMNGPRGASLETSTISSAIEAELGHIEAAYPEASITVDATGDVTAPAHPFLGSIFANLLRNAIEHNTESSPNVQVKVAIDEEEIQFEVKDNGPGIPENVLNAVNKSAQRDVDGMGLYIIHSLVEEYDGSLTIDSDSSGTTVSVVLPMKTDGDHSALANRVDESRESVTIQQPIRRDESPSVNVVRTVAAASDRRIEDLAPLGHSIDTDALDSILQLDSLTRIEFQYEGYDVTLDPEEIRVEPQDTT